MKVIKFNPNNRNTNKSGNLSKQEKQADKAFRDSRKSGRGKQWVSV